MKPYEFRLADILFSDAGRIAFSAALREWKREYTGEFVVLDKEARYLKILVEYRTDWCAAELWIYGKDGQPFPDQIPLTAAELWTLRSLTPLRPAE